MKRVVICSKANERLGKNEMKKSTLISGGNVTMIMRGRKSSGRLVMLK